MRPVRPPISEMRTLKQITYKYLDPSRFQLSAKVDSLFHSRPGPPLNPGPKITIKTPTTLNQNREKIEEWNKSELENFMSTARLYVHEVQIKDGWNAFVNVAEKLQKDYDRAYETHLERFGTNIPPAKLLHW